MRETGRPTPPPAHPFHLLHPLNQQPPRHSRLRGAALIGPPRYPRQLKSVSPSHRVRSNDSGTII